MPPYIANIAPQGGVLGDRESISFQVGDADLRVIVTVEYPALRFTEVVHDGDNFTTAYTATSTRTVSYNQQQQPVFSYTILRSPVWPGVPTLKVYAFNTSGQEL